MHRFASLSTAFRSAGIAACIAVSLAGPPLASAQAADPVPASTPGTFHNPLLPSGADPWVIQHNGTYYYTNTTGGNLTLWATPDITDLAHARRKVVWTPPADGPYSHEIWAPELHFFDGKWYLYFAADRGGNDSHRIFVLENASADPLEGEWSFKGQVKDRTDKWAIDASAFEVNGQKYLVWSGWKGDTNGEQDIFLAHLKNPWTIDSERTVISYPKYTWEEVGDLLSDPVLPHVNVNEGPEILQHGNDIFLVYSGSGCWTDYYALGVVRAKATSNLLDANSWVKMDHYFFRMNPAGKVFGTGHNSFFKSPDGKQDWLLYHANDEAGQGCGGHRSPRAQPFTWGADGLPVFGEAVPTSQPLQKPSR